MSAAAEFIASSAEAAGGRWQGALPKACSGGSIDSRTLEPGNWFFALEGTRVDGHAYVQAAAEAGAAAAVVERVQPVALPQLVVDDALQALQALGRLRRQAFDAPVVAITGSSGKTTVKEALVQLLSGAFRLQATRGNLNNHLGVPLTLMGLDPDRHGLAIIEAGISRTGDMDLLGAQIEPDIALITSIGPAHLEGLGSLEGVAREKARLLDAVRAGGRALVPGSVATWEPVQRPRAGLQLWILERRDDPPGAEDQPPQTIFWNGPEGLPQEEPNEAIMVKDGCRWTLRQPSASPCSFAGPPLQAPGQRESLALALATALQLGSPFEHLQERLSQWQPPRQRGEWIERAGRLYYLDCYNANPQSLLDAATAFAARCPKPPRCWVLGGMRELGAQSVTWHQKTLLSMPLQAGDDCLLLGEDFATALDALPVEAQPPARCQRLTLEGAHAALTETAGPVFLKGSRAYQLEQLLPGAGERALSC